MLSNPPPRVHEKSDTLAIQAFITQHTDDLAAALAGGSLPSCTGDLATCNASLTTCTGSLGTCNSSLTTCSNDLGAAQSGLTTCTSSLGTCNTGLSAAQSDLTTCTSSLGTCNTGLSAAQSGLTTCTSSLGTCNTGLSAAQSGLSICTSNLGTCNTDLSAAQSGLTTCTSSLGTCNTDLGTCQTDLATCQAQPASQRLKTGQATCYDSSGAVIACTSTGQDGELQKGRVPNYVDNGDGTVTDTNTGLMWEKLSDDSGLHDKDNTYSWANAFTKVASLNATSFAGHNDWRLPNVNELQSLTKYGAVNPAVNPAFNTGCVASCTVMTCSCTASANYWSSTTYQGGASLAWRVRFFGGSVDSDAKSTLDFVRAVRDGS